MKKILKTIILFVIMFIGTLSVKALPTINYEFGKYVDFGSAHDDYIRDIEVTEDGYKILGENFKNKTIELITTDKNLNIQNSVTTNFEIFYRTKTLINNHVFFGYYDYSGEEDVYVYDVYNEKLEYVKTIKSSNSYIELRSPLKSENDKYFTIGLDIFDKKTNEIVNIEEIISDSEYKDELDKAIEEDNEKEYNEVLKKIYTDEFKGTYIPACMNLIYSENASYLNKYQVLNIDYNDEYLAFTYYYKSQNVYGIVIFDNNGEIIFDETVSKTTYPLIMLDKNNFYVIEFLVIKVLNEDSSVSDVKGYYKLSNYDYKGNIIQTKELSETFSQHDIYEGLFEEGRQLYDAVLTNDGFYLTTTSNLILRGSDPNIEEDDMILDYDPTFQKYYFIHPIETKTDGNGKIEVIENSRYGEKVSFVITPNEGYQIDIIKVTDADGNVLTFTDNAFTMPNANVTIDVSFVEEVKNSETADIAIMSCIIIIILGVIGTIYSIRKLSWLK